MYMKKIFIVCIICILLLSCKEKLTEAGSNGNSGKMFLYGTVVETVYTDDVLFSVKGLAEVVLVIGADTLAVTDETGFFRFEIKNEGIFSVYAHKDGYLYESKNINIRKGEQLERGFYLQRDDEISHGWNAFNMGARISIDSEGLALYSLGLREAYATKSIILDNHKSYIFSARVKKDVMTGEISFAVRPQISDCEWVYQTWMLDGWRHCVIEYELNDLTVIDSVLVYQGDAVTDTVYVYPDTVTVVLKIVVDGNTDHPAGSFTDIKVIEEGKWITIKP